MIAGKGNLVTRLFLSTRGVSGKTIKLNCSVGYMAVLLSLRPTQSFSLVVLGIPE